MQKRTQRAENPIKIRRKYRKIVMSTLSRISHIVPVIALKRKLTARAAGKNALKKIITRNISIPCILPYVMRATKMAISAQGRTRK